MERLPAPLLHAFADGQLPPAERRRVAGLLAADAEAAEAAEAIHALGDHLRAAPLPRPSMDAQLRWLSAWQAARDRSVRRLAGWMTAAAAVVLGVTLAAGRQASARPTTLAEWETAAVSSVDDDDAPRTARLIAVDLALPSPEATR